MARALFRSVRLYFDRGVFRVFFCDKRHRRFAYGVGVLLVALLVFETLIALWLNDVFGQTVNILANHKDHTPQEFYAAMHWWIFLSLGNDVVITVLTWYFMQTYALRWRMAVTTYYLRRWRYTPKASQRVEKDLPNFINTFLMLATGFLGATITLAAFIPKLWVLSVGLDVGFLSFLPLGFSKIPGIILWVLVIACAIATTLTWLVGWWLKEIEDNKLEADAALRDSLVVTADAIYPIRDHLRISPIDHVPLVYRAQMRYFKHNACVIGFVALYTLVLEILPYFIGVESLFAGAILYGTIVQIQDAFGNIKKSVSFFIENRSEFAALQARHKRLIELENDLGISLPH